MKTLETTRLILRPFVMGDLDDIHRLVYADPEVAPAWTARTKTIDEIQASFVAKVAQQENDFGFLAILLKARNELIGTVALQRYMPSDDTGYMVLESEPDYRVGSNPDAIEVELTYALGHAYWGQGYAAEAGRALIEHGFNEMGVSRIINSVNSQNIRSVNLMRRLGFRFQRNLHPNPFGYSDNPGVIGTLNNDEA
jgi:RimJ/RimL family protein N-acetyltransferase